RRDGKDGVVMTHRRGKKGSASIADIEKWKVWAIHGGRVGCSELTLAAEMKRSGHLQDGLSPDRHVGPGTDAVRLGVRGISSGEDQLFVAVKSSRHLTDRRRPGHACGHADGDRHRTCATPGAHHAP